jgi:adenine deaminase
MNYPGVFLGFESELEKIRAGKGKLIDGHAPGLRGRSLNAYALAGVRSDHESTEIEEAREKLRLGMHLLVREGSTERNLEHIISLVRPENASNCSFATDDKLPSDLLSEGHIDHSIRKAISLGVPAITAIQMTTWRSSSSGAFTKKGNWSRRTGSIADRKSRPHSNRGRR